MSFIAVRGPPFHEFLMPQIVLYRNPAKPCGVWFLWVTVVLHGLTKSIAPLLVDGILDGMERFAKVETVIFEAFEIPAFRVLMV